MFRGIIFFRLFFLILLLKISFSWAEVHPALKNAIDNGQIKKAQNLIDNIGIKDIYCPATLSIKSAFLLYGKRFKENPELLFSNCDPSFITSMGKNFCTKQYGESLCQEALRVSPFNTWPILLENIRTAKFFSSLQKQTEYEIIEVDTTLYECQHYIYFRFLISSKDSDLVSSKEYEEYERAQKKCKKHPTIHLRKKTLFALTMSWLENYLEQKIKQKYGWLDSTAQILWKDYQQMAPNRHHFPTVEASLDSLKKMYATTGAFDSSQVLFYCRLYPNIDKKIAVLLGDDAFSCEQITLSIKQNLKLQMEKIAENSSSFIDYRDGKKYVSIKIGTQIWMAENLNYETDSSWCYNGETVNCNTFGRLYSWSAAMNLSPKFDSLGFYIDSTKFKEGLYQGICPEGWHLPNMDDWTFLEEYAMEDSGDKCVGVHLKSKDAWNDNEERSSDRFGFAVLPAGARNELGNFFFLNQDSYFWSTGNDMNRGAYIGFYQGKCIGNNYFSKNYGYSVRCLKNLVLEGLEKSPSDTTMNDSSSQASIILTNENNLDSVRIREEEEWNQRRRNIQGD